MKNIIMEWANQNRNRNLPDWAQLDTLYNGSYVSPGGHPSTYLARTGNSSGKLRPGFAEALCRAAMIYNGCDKDGFGATPKSGIAEMTLSDKFEGNTVGLGEVASVVYDRDTGRFYAQIGGSAIKIDGNKYAKNPVAPLILAMWGVLMETPEFQEKFDKFATSKDQDVKRSAACWMCDFFYESTKGTLRLCKAAEVMGLSNTRRDNPRCTEGLTSYGSFSLFPVSGKGKKRATRKKAMKTKDFNGAFAFRKEPLTAEQEARVPKLGNEYVVSPELLTLCEHIKQRTKRRRPIRNILLRGEPGVGKSEMYVGIAAGCHLPLYTFAANAMTEPFDLFGQFVPVDENGNETGEKVPLDKILSGMPSATDISMDPAFAYQQITGMPKKDATPTECMAAIFNLAQKSLDVNGGQQRFKFAPGQLIYALRDGGVWGLDEVTLPQNPGVIPALNPAMDATQAITLPNGEVIHRHPDCIIVGTTNIDLEGCRQMNQTWQDRCQLILDLPEPSDNILLARIKAMVDWDEQEDSLVVDLQLFLKAYKEMKELARKRHISSGVIGPRKLADWVMSTLITGNPRESAEMTIIPGASTDPDDMAEFRQKLSDIF